MKLISKELAYLAILGMDVSEQDSLAQQFVKDGQKVKSTRADYKESAKTFGKIACALEVRLEAGKKARTFAPNKSLTEFIEGIAGQKPPTHAMTLKNAFGGFVLTKLITESDYDVNSSNCLELAARILAEVKGDLTHDAVEKAAAQLKERSDKEASNLRAILASVKPVVKMSAEDALEAFAQICADGHITACLAQLPDETMKMVEAGQKETYIAAAHTINRLDNKLGDKVNAWASEASATWRPVDQPVEIHEAGEKVGEVETATA